MTENQRRKFLKLVGASLAGAAGVSIFGCMPEKTEDAGDSVISVEEDVDIDIDITPMQDEAVDAKTLRREALAERLRELAWSEMPTDLAESRGVFCYHPMPSSYEKCLDCGEVMKVGEMESILSGYNVYFQRIQELHLDAKLIIPEHCPTCGFSLKKEKFHLEIKYPDDSEVVRVELDGSGDLYLMAFFLEGKDRYPMGGGEEGALKHKVQRLRKLFGINAAEMWQPGT